MSPRVFSSLLNLSNPWQAFRREHNDKCSDSWHIGALESCHDFHACESAPLLFSMLDNCSCLTVHLYQFVQKMGTLTGLSDRLSLTHSARRCG